LGLLHIVPVGTTYADGDVDEGPEDPEDPEDPEGVVGGAVPGVPAGIALHELLAVSQLYPLEHFVGAHTLLAVKTYESKSAFVTISVVFGEHTSPALLNMFVLKYRYKMMPRPPNSIIIITMPIIALLPAI